MTRILITGGAGFLGSHLVEKLLEDESNKITVIDNFHKGKRKNLLQNDRLECVTADILDNIDYYFREVEVVYHLAALTRPQESIIDPESTNTVNVTGTLKILSHCAKYRVRRVVFASTTGLYGTQEVLPIKETAMPDPMSPYALSKLVGEQYCQLFAKLYSMQINCIRPFNVYGTRQNPAGGYAAAVPKFIDLLNKNVQPWITGDGEQSRDFVYVEDVVDQLILMANSKVFGESFNCGSGNTTSINKLYQTIARLMDKNIEPKYISKVFEPPITLGDISKAETLLGWKPKVSLEEGLKKTIAETICEEE